MRPSTMLALALPLAALLVSPAAGEEQDPVLAALENPQATGVLVISVGKGSQAEKAGVVRGDVIVTYDGKPTRDVPSLTRAKGVATSKLEVVMEIVRRDGKLVPLKLQPGQIGVNLVPVTKGKPADPLPPSTGVKFDFSSLAKNPWDTWYSFSVDKKTKSGFEHVKLSLDEGKLVLRHEVAFDGGERWGVNHFDVKVTVTAKPTPELLKTRFESPNRGWIALGRVKEFDDGTRDWTTTVRRCGEEPKVSARPVPKDSLPSYLVPHLAAFMPREKGACIHFRPLTERTGEVDLPAALICVGEDEIDRGGEKVKTAKFEQRTIGGEVRGTYWVGPSGQVLMVDYRGARATLSTKEAALKDLHPNIEPRTAE